MNTVNTDRIITNLDPSSTYHFRVYEYDVDANGNTYYLTSSYSERSGNTASAPTQASGIFFENITGTSAVIKHTPGEGTYRLIVMKQGSAVDAIPADLTWYNGNQAFGQGPQLTPGNYIMIGGTNSTALNVTGLSPGSTYHVAVFGFNGNNYPVYANPPATAVLTIPNQPTAPGQGFQTNTIEGNSFRMQWSGGDGSGKIVIARKGAPVSALPVDGTTYDADEDFGNGDEIETGQFVIYNGVNRGASIQNLEIGSTYHIAVFEYNLSGGSPDYLTGSSLTGSGTTLSTPTLQTRSLFASNIQNTQATINFTSGDGVARIFIMRASSAVTEEPEDLVNYSFSPTYGSNEIGTGNYIVQKTLNNSPFAVTSLNPNTQYHVAVFEYNGSTAPVYLRPAATFEFTTTGSGITPPVTNSMNPSFSLTDGNKLKFNWSSGDGNKRIVVMKQGSPVSFSPADGSDYPANASFGNGTDLGNGQYIVYNGSQDNVTVMDLAPSTTYHFAVFEYNGTGAATSYLITAVLVTNGSTATTPAAGSTGVAGAAGNLTITLNWNSGPGAGRLVVMKEGSAITGIPADLSKYPADPVFGNGTQVGTSEYVVYAGPGNTVTVTGLENNKTYHYTVFEYNGVDAPMYNTVNAISNSTVISESLPLKWLSFTATEENGRIQLEWATAQEYNTAYFVVERSLDNGNFIALDTQPAKGGDIRNEYSFSDRSNPSGIVSYRIKQVDIDNRYEYSKQATLRAINQQTALKLYPNPAPGYTRISLPQNIQQATLKIFDMKGAMVKTIAVSNAQLIDLQGLPRGIYQAVINDGSGLYSERFVIR